MKDNIERINSTKNERDSNEKIEENSPQLKFYYNSEKELSKFSPSTSNQHSSYFFPKTIYNINLSNKESNILNKNNLLSYYTRLTSQILSKDIRFRNNKNYRTKKELCKENFNCKQKIKIHSSNFIRHKSYNKSKQLKSFSNNNKTKYIFYNKKNRSLSIRNKKEIQIKESLNMLIGKNKEKNNNDKNIINEEKNPYFIYNEISKNSNIIFDKNEKNNKQAILQNEEEKKEDIITKKGKKKNMPINNETYNLNYKEKSSNNNVDNHIYIKNENLKYINNMKINFNNLNIYNVSNIEQNFNNMNMDYPNEQQLYCLQINNNGYIYFGNIIYNTNFYNIYKDINKNNISQNINQNKRIDINLNAYFHKNNKNHNYSIFDNIDKDIIFNRINKYQNESRKKKCKILDNSFYLDKSLNFLGENLFKLCRDQGACRYLQKLLDSNPQETLNYLYKPLCKNIIPLINFPFGNYLIQKIIIYLNQDQLYEILNLISHDFLEICNNIFGTRVIQTIINNLKTPKVKDYFYQLLKPKIIELFKVLNGTFVVQKFSQIHTNYKNEISDIMINGCHILSTHKHGSCVIQKYLELNDSYLVPKLIDKLLDQSLVLIVDKYANYVIQTILKKNNKNYGNKFAEKIKDNVVYYAKNKYSSNVVRECLDCCDGIYLLNLISNVQQRDNLIELILDEHGNYIAQKVLILSTPIMQTKMLKIIKENLNRLKKRYHGEILINKLIANYPIINNKNF